MIDSVMPLRDPMLRLGKGLDLTTDFGLELLASRMYALDEFGRITNLMIPGLVWMFDCARALVSEAPRTYNLSKSSSLSVHVLSGLTSST